VADDGSVYSSLSRAVRNLMRLNIDWQVDLEIYKSRIWRGKGWFEKCEKLFEKCANENENWVKICRLGDRMNY